MPDIKPGWQRTPGELASLARIKGLSASEKAMELADALMARALETGDAHTLESAARALTLAVKAREME